MGHTDEAAKTLKAIFEGQAKPASSEKKGEIGKRAQASSFAQKRSKKLSSALGFFERFPVSRRFAAEGPRKPASSAEEGKNGRRAQEWGSKGQRSRLPARSALIRVPPAHRAPRESLSTFFSKESRGPSRPERQMKRSLRGKSEAEKGKRQTKNAHTKPHGRQTDTWHKSRHKSGRLRKSGRPGRRRGTPGAEKPLRTGKTRVRSFACPEGLCETGPPKNRFAVFGCTIFLASRFYLLRIACSAARSAEQKGRRPLLSPASFLKKA